MKHFFFCLAFQYFFFICEINLSMSVFEKLFETHYLMINTYQNSFNFHLESNMKKISSGEKK